MKKEIIGKLSLISPYVIFAFYALYIVVSYSQNTKPSKDLRLDDSKPIPLRVPEPKKSLDRLVADSTHEGLAYASYWPGVSEYVQRWEYA